MIPEMKPRNAFNIGNCCQTAFIKLSGNQTQRAKTHILKFRAHTFCELHPRHHSTILEVCGAVVSLNSIYIARNISQTCSKQHSCGLGPHEIYVSSQLRSA